MLLPVSSDQGSQEAACVFASVYGLVALSLGIGGRFLMRRRGCGQPCPCGGRSGLGRDGGSRHEERNRDGGLSCQYMRA